MLSLKQDILEGMPAELPDFKMLLLLGLKRILFKKKKIFFPLWALISVFTLSVNSHSLLPFQVG